MKSGVQSRRAAREAAFKAVYAVVIGGATTDDALVPEVLGTEFAAEALEYIRSLVEAARCEEPSWDRPYEGFLPEEWPLERLAVTDRLVLRMACIELWTMPGVPPKVTISEYVALAKDYGTAESGKFVNGVLASVLATSPKADWAPPTDEPRPARPKAEKPQADDKKKPATKRWVIKSDG